jgi:hypothetical protein
MDMYFIPPRANANFIPCPDYKGIPEFAHVQFQRRRKELGTWDW